MKKSTALIGVVLIEIIALTGVLIYYNTIPPIRPPVAIAGGKQVVWAGTLVQLDGSGSYDPNGLSLIYNWSIVSRPVGSNAVLSVPTSVAPTFTPDYYGEWKISLIVGNRHGYSLPSIVNITAKPWFTEVARSARVEMPDMPRADRRGDTPYGPGVAFTDYDNDGDPDLYVPGYTVAPNFLYRNNGDGTFTDVAAEAGVDYMGNTFCPTFADYDNDGNLDLYLVNYGNASRLTDPGEANVLYHNNGDGTFTDVTQEAGVGDMGHGIAAAWADYDKDGDLDLFVANRGIMAESVRLHKNETCVLYRNNGDGTFTNVAPQLNICQGVTGVFPWENYAGQNGHYWQPLWFDYDLDGDVDLFISGDMGVSLLYRNNGDGTFTDVTRQAGLWVYQSGMGADVGDYDNDGDLDLYVGTWDRSFFWRNNGDGTFTDVSVASGAGGIGVTMVAAFLDFDNDGYLDILTVNGAMDWRYGTREGRERWNRDKIFRNNHDGTFTDVTDLAGIGDTSMGEGGAIADFDGDGDLDFYVFNYDDRNFLYRNDFANFLGNSWIKIRLNGTVSNCYGVGAIVKVTSGTLMQVKQLLCGQGYESQNELLLHFGLGKHAAIDMIEIKWPSGIVQVLTNIQVNQTITITETSAGT